MNQAVILHVYNGPGKPDTVITVKRDMHGIGYCRDRRSGKFIVTWNRHRRQQLVDRS